MRWISILVLVAFAAPWAASDDRHGVITHNGWSKMDESSRFFYVVGLRHGLQWGNPEVKEAMLADLGNDDHVDAVNQFYSDYANRNIPVAYAFLIIKLRVDGKPESVIEEMLGHTRELFSEK